jgi:uncharacterized protein (DUF58 family)
MITPETLRRIRQIELKTRRIVESAFAGAYHTAFKGRGIAFDSVRPYEPGDDVRDIEWNITARMGEPYIKEYTEERELTVMLVLDVSASILFGTVARQKREVAAELGAVLALSAISNNDKVGMVLFSDQLEQYVAPRKGRKHVLRLIRELLAAEPSQKGTDLTLALRTVNRSLKRRAIIFLISDFLVDHVAVSRELMALNRKHDVVAIVTKDPMEQQFADVGLVAVEDAETGDIVRVDTRQARWMREYNLAAQEHEASLDHLLRRAQVDRLDLAADGEYIPMLTAFFQRRAMRKRR